MSRASAEHAVRTAPLVVGAPVWIPAVAAHEARVDALTAGHRGRAARGERHPTVDFLHTYYSYRPSQLRRWHPGPGVELVGAGVERFLALRDHARTASGGVALDTAAFMLRRGDAVRRVRDLLAATAGRAPMWGCLALHEWAMVYRSTPEQVRHAGLPLRLGHAGTDAVVEAHPIRCTHFDAFRFFTDPARPLNALQPTRESQVDLEQPACLHAGMDLYKWAYKLAPAVPADLVADAYELAHAVRRLDMAASPYDVSVLGDEPVAIETAEGRAVFVRRQRELAALAEPVRERLLEVCDVLLAGVGSPAA